MAIFELPMYISIPGETILLPQTICCLYSDIINQHFDIAPHSFDQ